MAKSLGGVGSTSSGPIRLSVEGNIAAGKSTLLRLLAEELDFVVVPEPLNKWQCVAADASESESDGEGDAALHRSASQEPGSNLLQMFYDDPTRWGFTFQLYVLLSRMRQYTRPLADFLDKTKGLKAVTSDKFRPKDTEEGGLPGEKAVKKAKTDDGSEASVAAAPPSPADSEPLSDAILLFERSVMSDRHVFVANCHATGLFQDCEAKVFGDWHSWLLKSFQPAIDGFVYLRVSPDTCLKRLHKRARPEERGVDITYLSNIHDRHEEWLHAGTASTEFRAPVLVIDCDEEFETSPARQAEIKAKMREFVRKLREQPPKADDGCT